MQAADHPHELRFETKRFRRILAVVLVAAALRLAGFLLFADLHGGRGDEGYYLNQARSLAFDGSYPGALRPPAQAAAMALVFLALGDDSLTGVRLLQLAFSLVTVALIIDVVWSRIGRRAAVAAGLLCALDPTLMHYSHLLWSETLYGMLLVLTVWSLERFERSRETGWVVLGGASLGIAALTRETATYVAPVAALWLLLPRDGRAIVGRLRPAALFVLVTVGLVAPWVVRNSLKYGAFVSISTNRWRMIAQGNVDPLLESRLRARSGEGFVYRGERRPLERERLARSLALEAIVARQPWWIIEKLRESTTQLIVTKSQLARYVKRRWLPPSVMPFARVLITIQAAALALQLAVGVAGLWLARAGRLQTLIASIVATHWALYVLAFAHNRFLVPLLPLLAIVGGPLLVRPVLRGAPRWQLVGAVASLLILVGLVVSR